MLISGLHLVGALVTFLVTWAVLLSAAPVSVLKYIDSNNIHVGRTSVHVKIAALASPETIAEELFVDHVEKVKTSGLTAKLCLILTFSIVDVAFSSSLFHGVRKCQPQFMQPWIIMEIMVIVYSLASFIIKFASLTFTFLELIGNIICLLINNYCFLCIWSARKEFTVQIEAEKEKEKEEL